MPLNVLIIGAGIGGLATAISLKQKGHQVNVFEASRGRTPGIGAGIAINPNSARIFNHLGLYKAYLARAGTAEFPRFQRRYNGELISHRFAGDSTAVYGYPMTWIHRADLIDLFDARARELGIPVHMGCPVTAVDESEKGPTLTLADGTQVTGDLVVGADGIKSLMRSYVLGQADTTVTTSASLLGTLSVYRLAIPGKIAREDPQIAHLMTGSHLWMGPGSAGAGAPLRDGAEYGLELAHDDSFDASHSPEGMAKPRVGHWATYADLDEVRRMHKDWDPAVQRVLELANSCLAWRILETGPLARWVSTSGRIVIIGDAAHAMKPYAGQGGAMAIEDAACLTECVSRARSPSQLPELLHIFEGIRKPRAELVARRSHENAVLYHLADGPEQEARDKKMSEVPLWKEGGEWDGKPMDELPDGPKDPRFMLWLFAADIVAQTNTKLDSLNM